MKYFNWIKTIALAIVLATTVSNAVFAQSTPGRVYTDPTNPSLCAATVYGWVSAPADSWIEANLGSGIQQFGRGTHSGEFSADLRGLTPNTVYSYRMAATNPYTGARYEGNIETFSTTGCGGTQVDNTTPTVSVHAIPSTIRVGESSSLSWYSSNATRCTNNFGGGSATSGSATVVGASAGTYTYTVTCTRDSNGRSATGTATVTVTGQQQTTPTVSLYASPSTVNVNGSSVLNWSSSNASYCMASGNNWSGSKSVSGSESVTFYSQGTQTFSLTCYSSTGQSATAQTSVVVTQTNTGAQATVTTSGVSNVTSTGATLNGYVNPNGSSDTVRYFEYGRFGNFNNVTNAYSQGTNAGSYSDGVSGLLCGSEYNYRAVARNSYGTSYGSTVTFTTSSCGTTTNGQAPSAITTAATGVGYTSARINGVVVPTTTTPTTIYFEYGTTPSLGNRTPSRSINESSSTNVLDILTGLNQGTTYYYRVVAENQFGTSRGSIASFRTDVFSSNTNTTNTNTTTTTNTTIRNTTTVVDYKSCGNGIFVQTNKTCPVQGVISTSTIATGVINVNTVAGEAIPALAAVTVEKISIQNGDVCENVYRITYTNTSDKNLSNVLVKVSLPQELAFVSSTAGTFRDVDNTLTLAVNDLPAKATNSFTVTTRINEGSQLGKTVSVSAYLAYTDLSNGATTQNEVTGYSLLTINTECKNETNSNVQSGATGFSSFLPSNLVQWLVLIAAIIVIVVAARNLFKKTA